MIAQFRPSFFNVVAHGQHGAGQVALDEILQEGRVLVEGTPDEIKRNAKVQEAYLGGVHGVLPQEALEL